jgi:transposase
MTVKRRVRRRWSDDFKRRVVAEADHAGASCAAVARRHDLNANLLFKWRRDPRFNGSLSDPQFLPVAIISEAAVGSETMSGAEAASDKTNFANTVSGGWLEIDLPCGTRLRCGSDLNAFLLTEVLSVLRQKA